MIEGRYYGEDRGIPIDRYGVPLSSIAAEHMAVVVSLVDRIGEGLVHCFVGVSWEVWPHATWVTVVVERLKRVGAATRPLTNTPKDLLVTCLCETNYEVSQTNA